MTQFSRALAASAAFFIGCHAKLMAADEAACELHARQDYTKSFVELSQSPAPIPVRTIELTIALRRLEEEFCLRVAHCTATQQIPIAVEFSKCLNDDAAERLRDGGQ